MRLKGHDEDEANGAARRSGWPRAILHLDMDAFFVNVHLLEHAEDAGIPLAVGGKPGQRGVVASASYEARQRGIHSAMPMRTAVKLCPELKIVPANWSRIKACSHQIMALLGPYGPLEQLSVDEAFIDLSEQAAPVRLSHAIRHRIKEETGLPASVGLATNKLLAKVASEQGKPEGCTIVLPGTEARFLAPLPVRVIWGIGPRSAERLAGMGIHTCGQLAAASEDALRQAFGNQAAALKARAQGQDSRRVNPERGPARSISAEWTFSQDVADSAQLLARLEESAAQVGRSLRRQELVAHTVWVKFRKPDFTTFTRQRTLPAGIDSDEEIRHLAELIWRENWPPGQPMRLLGVGVGNLKQAGGRQLAFDFDKGE